MWLKIKLIIGSLVIILGLSTVIFLQYKHINSVNQELKTAVENIKAYEQEHNILKDEANMFKYTASQLNNSKDSLVRELNQTRKQLGIKDKNLKELQYLASHNFKTDTLIIKDTIFRENLKLDTLIKDNWAALRLQLEYPGKIAADYSFNNETVVISSSKRETINPPYKFWLFRLFQRKHIVTEIDVIQKNPYCKNDIQKHITINER